LILAWALQQCSATALPVIGLHGYRLLSCTVFKKLLIIEQLTASNLERLLSL